jgi:catechol 2,3-dioxygenase-like lactoylglutathione lyase family enzyme
MVQQLHHTGFVVRDRDKSVAFYRDIVGFKVVGTYERIGPEINRVVGYEDAHLKLALLDLGGGHMLELIQYVSPSSYEHTTTERNVLGAAHLALQVEDISAMFEKLSEGGAKIMNPPAQIAPGRIVCYLQDPDGNWLEIMELSE